MERKNKKIVAGMMAGFCVLSTQTLVQYGLLVGNGGIATKNSPNLQACGISDENVTVENVTVENALVESRTLEVMRTNNGSEYCRNNDNQGVTLLLYDCTDVADMEAVRVPESILDDMGNRWYVTRVDRSAFSFGVDWLMQTLTIQGRRTVIEPGALDQCYNLTTIFTPRNAQCRNDLDINGVNIEDIE